jgi:hypothetical protein
MQWHCARQEAFDHYINCIGGETCDR